MKIRGIKKKVLSAIGILLIIMMILSSCTTRTNHSISTNNGFNEDQSTEENLQLTEVPSGYIGIYTIDDLYNSDKNADANYILMNDIDLTEDDDWEGINNYSIFDGNYHTISNLKSTTSGLFEEVKFVKNLTLENISIQNADGGLAMLAGSIINCTVTGKISDSGFGMSAGGVAGSVACIRDCKSYVDIISQEGCCGGICVSLRKNDLSDASLLIENCENYGDITIKECWGATGGVVGYAAEGFTAHSLANYGDLYITDRVSSSHDYDYKGVGGLIGSANNGSISNCCNQGDIFMEGRIKPEGYVFAYTTITYGGLVGVGPEQTKKNPNPMLTIRDSYNSGMIDTEVYHRGGLVGHMENTGIDIQYCNYIEDNGISATPTGAMFPNCNSLSEEQMRDANNYSFEFKDSWENTDNYPKYIKPDLSNFDFGE